jgi:uncharacterized coiled-coil protein SlyX
MKQDAESHNVAAAQAAAEAAVADLTMLQKQLAEAKEQLAEAKEQLEDMTQRLATAEQGVLDSDKAKADAVLQLQVCFVAAAMANAGWQWGISCALPLDRDCSIPSSAIIRSM